MSLRGHCALCAPTVFLVRIKAIRTKNTVIDKNKDGAGVLSKIADRVRSDRPKRKPYKPPSTLMCATTPRASADRL